MIFITYKFISHKLKYSVLNVFVIRILYCLSLPSNESKGVDRALIKLTNNHERPDLHVHGCPIAENAPVNLELIMPSPNGHTGPCNSSLIELSSSLHDILCQHLL